MQPNREDEIGKVTIFFAKWCGTCKKIVPSLTSVANEAGLGIRFVDVDDPDSKNLCSHVRWVPYIEYNGSEISIQEFLQLASKLDEKEE